MIQSHPFATDLVIRRNDGNAARWAATRSRPYFTYRLHVSGTFLQAETLCSALYLLVLRLMARDYVGATALVASIATDARLTDEEKQVFGLLARLRAGHPDFHAVRARCMLALAESPTVVPWDIRAEQAMYTSKLSHVSARCRLSQQEEIRALELCLKQEKKLRLMNSLRDAKKESEREMLTNIIVDDQNPPEEREIEDRRPLSDFLLEARTMFRSQGLTCDDDELTSLWMQLMQRRGKWQLPEVHEMVLWNRRKLLEVLAPYESATAPPAEPLDADVKAPKPPGDARRICHSSNGAAHGEHSIGTGRQKYNDMAKTFGATEALQLAAQAYAKGGETLNGDHASLGFLFLYELFTESKSVRFGSGGMDNPAARRANHTFASLMYGFFNMGGAAAKQPSHGLRESLLTILTRNPWVAPAMPQFTDTRGETGRTLNWSGKHTSKEDPLSGVLHKAILALKALQARGFLLGDKLPSGGFVAPVEVPLLPVPRDQDAIDAMIDKDAQPPPKVAVVVPPTGAKKHAGELPLPATTVSVVLEPVAAHGAEGTANAVRWRSGLKGLLERSTMPCEQPSDYRCASLDLQPMRAAGAAAQILGMKRKHVLQLLQKPLAAIEPEKYIDLYPFKLPDDAGVLPFSVENHVDARNPMSKRALDRLRGDMARYDKLKRATKQPALKGLGVLQGLGSERPLWEKTAAEASLLLNDALRLLNGLQTALRKCKADDAQFVAAAYALLVELANEPFEPGEGATPEVGREASGTSAEPGAGAAAAADEASDRGRRQQRAADDQAEEAALGARRERRPQADGAVPRGGPRRDGAGEGAAPNLGAAAAGEPDQPPGGDERRRGAPVPPAPPLGARGVDLV